MGGNLVIGQSGGPTAVINASLAGVIEEAGQHAGIGRLLGMRWGIQGLLEEDLVDLRDEDPETLALLRQTPSSALGSCRLKVQDEHLPRILEVFRRFDIRYFFYIGGDDSQNTTHRVVQYCLSQGHEVCGIGIPKTVDNDLFGTDHTPGYGSAARYVALSMQQGGRLARDMQKVDPVLVYQAVGRDAGWLAAAAALAREEEGDPPHLVYVPEVPLSRDRLLRDAEQCLSRYGFVAISVGEGAVWENGEPVSGTQVRDRFGNPEFGAAGGASAAMVLKTLICNEFLLRGEFQVVESLQMAAQDRVSEVDREEAFEVGREAVRLAVAGQTGRMVTIEREPGPAYRVRYGHVPLTRVNEGKQRMPEAFLDRERSFVTDAFLDYVRPLAGGPLPRMARLRGRRAMP